MSCKKGNSYHEGAVIQVDEKNISVLFAVSFENSFAQYRCQIKIEMKNSLCGLQQRVGNKVHDYGRKERPEHFIQETGEFQLS